MRVVREENVTVYRIGYFIGFLLASTLFLSIMYMIILKKFLVYSMIPVAAFIFSTCYTIYKYRQQHEKHNVIF